MKSVFAAAFVVLASSNVIQAAELPIPIVAAENFYGEAATAIGGERVMVANIMIAPGTDPHDFEPPASVATSVADAKIVVMNGADYDHWIEHLLEASAADDRIVINVADLTGHKEGDNPHVWYDPKAMPALVHSLTETLIKLDPEGKAGYEQRRDAYLATLDPLEEKIADTRAKFQATPVAATEPVFGYMAEALGLRMQNQAFQTAIMNESEPTAGDVAAMEDDIRNGRVKVLFYNAQVEDSFTKNLAELAKQAGVAVVGVTETLPPGKSFPEWMLDQLDATAKALGDASS